MLIMRKRSVLAVQYVLLHLLLGVDYCLTAQLLNGHRTRRCFIPAATIDT